MGEDIVTTDRDLEELRNTKILIKHYESQIELLRAALLMVTEKLDAYRNNLPEAREARRVLQLTCNIAYIDQG